MADSPHPLKFRTPTRCQNGHFRWYFYEVSFGRCFNIEWSEKPCDCPTGDVGEGFDKCGPDQQFTGVVDKNGTHIYQGDILAYPVSITLRDEHVWPHKEWTVEAKDRFMKVEFDNGCFWVLDSAREFSWSSRCGIGWANTKEMEVVRHVYE